MCYLFLPIFNCKGEYPLFNLRKLFAFGFSICVLTVLWVFFVRVFLICVSNLLSNLFQFSSYLRSLVSQCFQVLPFQELVVVVK